MVDFDGRRRTIAERQSVLTTESAVLDLVTDGMTIAIGGFNTASHPMPIVRGIIRRGIKELRIVGGTIAGLELDLLIGAGCVREVVTSSVTGEALAAVGPWFRHAAETGEVSVWEADEGILYAGLRAAGQGLPFLPWKAGIGTSIPELNRDLKVFRDPIGGEELLAVPPIRPDIAFLHVEAADCYGLGQHTGSGFGDRLLHRAASMTVLSAERIVSNEEIRRNPLATSIPYADRVIAAPWGSHPFSSPGNYVVDEVHLAEYLTASRQAVRGDRSAFDAYLDRYVFNPVDHAGYLEQIGIRRIANLGQVS